MTAAINDPDVDTIYYRTFKYADITIKANENAKNKNLIINAQHLNVTNKAVFNSISIYDVCNYVEKVSGNRITLLNLPNYQSFKVAKNKTVDRLGIVSSYDFNNTYNKYILRKGSKVNEVMLFFDDGVSEIPAASTYDENKREISIEYTDNTGDARSYKFALNKDGRITKMVSDKTVKYDYTFTYDDNGNMIGIAGFDEDDGDFKATYKVENNLPKKFSLDSEYRKYVENYVFDEKGRVVARKDISVTEDGEIVTCYSFNYDLKGRLIYEYVDYGIDQGKRAYYHTYNSKNFLVKTVMTCYTPDGQQSGDSEITTCKFNKSGLMTKKIITVGDAKTITKYTYDEFDLFIDETTTTDEGTGIVELPMTEEDFREFNHFLFVENQQEKMFERHTSQRVRYYNDFPLADDAAYDYYVTPDSVYLEAANWMEYSKNRLVYKMLDTKDPKNSVLLYTVDLTKDYASNMWRYMPTDENDWIDYERDQFLAAYKEDGKIHILTNYDEELSKDYAENVIGVEYEGETYLTESVFDAKNYDYLEMILTKILGDKSEIVCRIEFEYDQPEPAACTALRCAFESKPANMVNATFVMDPGTKNEIRKTFKVPVNTNIAYVADDLDNLVVFSDDKCENEVTGPWDKMSDITRYFKHIEPDK